MAWEDSYPSVAQSFALCKFYIIRKDKQSNASLIRVVSFTSIK
jgi:hypothetical protein